MAERADRIGEFWGSPATRTFGELLIDLEEDRVLRAFVVRMLKDRAPPAAHALGRGAAISVLSIRRVAAGEGLGASYARAVTPPQLLARIAIALAIGGIAIGIWVLAASIACALDEVLKGSS